MQDCPCAERVRRNPSMNINSFNVEILFHGENPKILLQIAMPRHYDPYGKLIRADQIKAHLLSKQQQQTQSFPIVKPSSLPSLSRRYSDELSGNP